MTESSSFKNAATPHQCFEVPLIYSRNEHEFHNQMVNTMSYLRTCIDTSFKVIRERIDMEKKRLEQIQTRTNNAEMKIKTVSQTEDAVVVCSSAKYPAPAGITEVHVPVMADVKQTKIERPSYVYPVGYTGGTVVNMEEKNESDCSKYALPFEGRYLPKIPSTKKERTNGMSGDEHEGLGRSPARMNSVCSLLLFNTKENPYKKFPRVDNLEGVEKGEGKREAIDALAGPPISIVKNTRLDMFSHHNYEYLPKVGEIPFGDAPPILPGLHNVAPNLILRTNTLTSIAPSAYVGKNLPPTVEQAFGSSSRNAELPLPVLPSPALSSLSASSTFSSSSSSSYSSCSSSSSTFSSSPSSSAAPPPPPPLPPLPVALPANANRCDLRVSESLPVPPLSVDPYVPVRDLTNIPLPPPPPPLSARDSKGIPPPLPLPPVLSSNPGTAQSLSDFSPASLPDLGNMPTPPPVCPDGDEDTTTMKKKADEKIRGLKPVPAKTASDSSSSSSSSAQNARRNVLSDITTFDVSRLRKVGAAVRDKPTQRTPSPNAMAAGLRAVLDKRRKQIHPEDENDDDSDSDKDW